MTFKTGFRSLAFITISSFLLAACGIAGSDPEGAPDAWYFDSPEAARADAVERGDTLLADVLEDGDISRREYELLSQRALECYLDTGIATQTGETIWDPIDNLQLQTPLDYRDPPATEAESAVLNECLLSFDYPHMVFQTENEPRMNADLLAYVRACLKDKGFETQEDATWLGNLVGPDASELPNHMGIDECVIDGARELYPDLQVVSIAY